MYTPAHKLAGWLEYYAEAMELNVWTSSGVSGTLKFNSWTELLSRQNDMTIKVANNMLTITFMINSMAVASFSGTWPGTSVFNVQGRMQWN